MLNLDPAKLLVIAVVAIILLGPDKLPQVARQVGGAWRSFNEFRHRMETEVRSSMPDLPSTTEIARLARSPSALLDHLSNMGTDETEDEDGAPPGSEVVDDAGPHLDGTEPGAVVAGDVTPALNGSAPSPVPAPASETVTNGSVPPEPDAVSTAPLSDATLSSPAPAEPPDVTPAQRSQDVIVPGDPSLN
jgi:sec-independent protein translocase protein TatB